MGVGWRHDANAEAQLRDVGQAQAFDGLHRGLNESPPSREFQAGVLEGSRGFVIKMGVCYQGDILDIFRGTFLGI